MTIQGSGCGIFKVQLKNFIIENDRKVTLEQIHSVPWGKGNYYLSGPTSIIYNSLGTLDKGSIFDAPYRLFNMSDNSEIEGLAWTTKCYNSKGEIVDTNKVLGFIP
jgi:hypothetical protein